MKNNPLGALLLGGLTCLGVVSCGPKDREQPVAPKPSNYALRENWLNLPSGPWKEVDLFYAYPTVYSAGATGPNISPIDHPAMRAGAQMTFGIQASAFAATANLYAPYYRQADLTYALSLPPKERDAFIGGIPSLDVTTAFEYYIAHYNAGRPFILAGHSQGSQILLNLLTNYMKKNPAVYNRMIAAYVIGYTVTNDDLTAHPHLKFAQGPGDTGVIISYNTQAPVIAAPNPVVMPGALVINPITWTREETRADASQSLGAMLPGPTGALVPMDHFADAQVDRSKGVLICSTIPETLPQSPNFPKGVYHPYDYSFYYKDLAANAAYRIKRFLGQSTPILGKP